jgi:hypothetical protein
MYINLFHRPANPGIVHDFPENVLFVVIMAFGKAASSAFTWQNPGLPCLFGDKKRPEGPSGDESFGLST